MLKGLEMTEEAAKELRNLRLVRQRYLGVLDLLARASVYVPGDLRERMEQAFEDACKNDPDLKWKRVADIIQFDW